MRAPESRAIAYSTSCWTADSAKTAFTRSRRIGAETSSIAPRVVAERVVRGHQRALGGGDHLAAGGDLAVEALEAPGVRGGAAAVAAGPLRVGLDQRVAQAGDGRDRSAGVLPPVRVVGV